MVCFLDSFLPIRLVATLKLIIIYGNAAVVEAHLIAWDLKQRRWFKLPGHQGRQVNVLDVFVVHLFFLHFYQLYYFKYPIYKSVCGVLGFWGFGVLEWLL